MRMYRCISSFVDYAGHKFYIGDRIGYYEYLALTSTDKNFFEEIVDELQNPTPAYVSGTDPRYMQDDSDTSQDTSDNNTSGNDDNGFDGFGGGSSEGAGASGDYSDSDSGSSDSSSDSSDSGSSDNN